MRSSRSRPTSSAPQEPGTNDQIKQFCSTKYSVSFPLFSKIVVKGKGIHPLYEFLTTQATDPKHAGPITWNFAKFLVNRKGEVVARFQPGVKPESHELDSAIEKASGRKVTGLDRDLICSPKPLLVQPRPMENRREDREEAQRQCPLLYNRH